MRNFRALTAVFFIGLMLTAAACGQDDNYEEVEMTMDQTFDPKDENQDPPPGGN